MFFGLSDPTTRQRNWGQRTGFRHPQPATSRGLVFAHVLCLAGQGKIFGGRVLMAELDFCEAIQPNYIGVLSMLRQRGNVDGYFDSFHEMNLVNMRAASVSST